MKDLERMYDEAVEIINECINGVEIHPIKRPLKVNTRAKSRWGCMKYNRKTGERTIEISSRILADDVPYDATMGTVIHEILHACKGCKGHQGLWKRYANAINNKYPQYNIQRTSSAEAFGLDSESRAVDYKYAIRCVDCGHVYRRSKKTAIIQRPQNYRCKCGGKLERVDLVKTEILTTKPTATTQLCLWDLM